MEFLYSERLKRVLRRVWLSVVALVVLFFVSYAYFFGPIAETDSVTVDFVVLPEETTQTSVAQELGEKGLIKSPWAFRLALALNSSRSDIRPGGYELRKSMDVWTVAETLNEAPKFAFVTFPKGIRKEQMAEILAKTLFWSEEQKHEFLTVATKGDRDFIEGVYYPDTYFIPSDQSPGQVASRLRGRFTDVFEPYAKEAKEKGLEWTDVLILASLIEREAAKNDKELISGILWNRLRKDMLLQVDASLQYVKGAEGNWWPQPTSSDKYVESPFNTYKYVGLPPHPINNPSLESIAAALNPEKTDCLYYLHDNDHVIHCSVSYSGQKANVNKYLK